MGRFGEGNGKKLEVEAFAGKLWEENEKKQRSDIFGCNYNENNDNKIVRRERR